jgi:hypothetical protein
LVRIDIGAIHDGNKASMFCKRLHMLARLKR